jgi:glycosyltransferase involved in cell wall biosynthesis
VSCIIPAFNAERYLQEALDSIFAQTYAHLEVIVVDDGSTDGTARVAAQYGSRLRCLHQSNAGSAAARNRGLAAARGELVAFLDADDLWRPEKLALQVARFQARPELDLCVSHVQNFWVAELHQEAERFRTHPRGQPIPGYWSGALVARRALFDTLGGFSDTLGHADDTEWLMRAAEQGALMELLPDVLTDRRLHPANLSRQMAAESRAEYLRLVKASLDRRRGRGGGQPRLYAFPSSRDRGDTAGPQPDPPPRSP